MQGTPHEVENVPPDREKEPDDDRNPERQGPDPGSPDERTEKVEEGEEGGPPPESIPGDQGDVPNPKQ
jgi:hypothetical protein